MKAIDQALDGGPPLIGAADLEMDPALIHHDEPVAIVDKKAVVAMFAVEVLVKYVCDGPYTAAETQYTQSARYFSSEAGPDIHQAKGHGNTLQPCCFFAHPLLQGFDLHLFLGGNPPFQVQQTVVNGLMDAPGGATRREFPLVVTAQDPVFPMPRAWAWNVTLERQLP